MAQPVTGQAQGILLATSQKSGQPAALSTGWHNELSVTEVLPRFAYLALVNSVYSASTAGGGVALAATNLFSTAIGTFTPVLAVYNPIVNNKNLVVLSAWAGFHTATATQATTGGLFFVCGAGQTITNAQSATPVNNTTLKATGSSAIGITNAVLAGASGNSTLLRPMQSSIGAATITSETSGLGNIMLDPIDGSIVIPPGGYLGIANGVSVATGNVVAGISWAELPL